MSAGPNVCGTFSLCMSSLPILIWPCLFVTFRQSNVSSASVHISYTKQRD
jgi:hypothetical protein